ncbi:MAG TPA: ribonuclease III, partial [Candidatus Moranbacteria bacterium]|nr:ribonuclease III [Candidatus Moranbacteria bacterium]
KKFLEKSGLKFNRRDFLEIALTHRSYLNEHPEYKLGHNERQEFLGDAVLEMIVTDYLFRHYDNPEGDLTAWRAALVNTDMLAKVAEELSLRDVLRMSKGEAVSGKERARLHILANTVEALIGGIYLDQGYAAAEKFVRRKIIDKHLDEILRECLWKDPKTLLQEKTQKFLSATPRYETVKEEGPDHNKSFTVEVYLGEKAVAVGSGPSKQEAQRRAARAALKKKGWDKVEEI